MPKEKIEKISRLENLAKLIRYYCLLMTTKAKSGHLTSALSAADLMTVLFFEKLRFDLKNPKNYQNDRLIFSKGHASPLFYALYRAANVVSDRELDGYRQLGNRLEGHPTPAFTYVDVATGSLGQGISAGVGMSISAKYLDKTSNKIYVLLGDGELAEGSVWEAIEMASYYNLGNLVGIVDVNRLGQSQETILGHRVEVYRDRIAAFGWQTIVIDGHDFRQIDGAFNEVLKNWEKPTMIIAKTIKGKGVSFLEDKEGWHGVPLNDAEFQKAEKELGQIELSLVGKVTSPQEKTEIRKEFTEVKLEKITYEKGEKISTRKAFGEALEKLVDQNPNILVLDGDVKNSTYTQLTAENKKEHFWEMFIAEQNMVGVAAGLASQGKIPVVATFAAFLTRAFDQIRMNAISGLNIKYVGTHAGVSIGQDGPSQMGMEDLAMFRTVFGSTVLYPADGVAAARLTQEMINYKGMVYLRLARPDTPVIYKSEEDFPIGGSKTLAESKNDQLTIVTAGVTLPEALEAQKELEKKGINARVIDCYSVKPIDAATLKKAARETGIIITVEDHWFEGGLGDTVLNVFADDKNVKIYKMAVTQMPHSGLTADNLHAAEIDAKAIIQKVKQIFEEKDNG